MTTSFRLVSQMNTAFGNPQGHPAEIDWPRIRKQSLNICHEFFELMAALGADPALMKKLAAVADGLAFPNAPDLDKVRDALCDIHVFAYGAHHLMGIDADRDMAEVVGKLMTRFIKDASDLDETVEFHMARGVRDVYFEGQFPTLVMKSARDQPDAPRGKFLKSASYREPKFYDPLPAMTQEARELLDRQNELLKVKLPELTTLANPTEEDNYGDR